MKQFCELPRSAQNWAWESWLKYVIHLRNKGSHVLTRNDYLKNYTFFSPSSEVIKNFENIKKLQTLRPAHTKKAEHDVLGFMTTQTFCITSEEEKNKGIRNFRFFRKHDFCFIKFLVWVLWSWPRRLFCQHNSFDQNIFHKISLSLVLMNYQSTILLWS